MAFKEIWFRGLKGKDKEEFQQLLQYSPLREKAVEIVEGLLSEVERVNRKDYDNPAWAYRQAHLNGEVLAYQKVLEILRPEGNQNG